MAYDPTLGYDPAATGPYTDPSASAQPGLYPPGGIWTGLPPGSPTTMPVTPTHPYGTNPVPLPGATSGPFDPQYHDPSSPTYYGDQSGRPQLGMAADGAPYDPYAAGSDPNNPPNTGINGGAPPQTPAPAPSGPTVTGIPGTTGPVTGGGPLSPSAPGGTGTGAATTQEQALQMALQQGLQGEAAVQWVQQHYPQFNQPGSGIQYTPGNNTYGGNGWYAAPAAQPGGGQYGYDWINRSGSAGAGGGGGGALGSFSPNIPISQWSADPRTNDLINTLAGRAKQSLNVDPNDPLIRNQVDSFSAAETNQQRNYLSDLAEQGGGTANLGMEKRMSSEKIGQDTGQFQGQLMWQELSARRQEIQSALTQIGQTLSDQERMDLQNQLAIMDNLLGQAGLQQGAYQFDANDQYRNSPLSL